MIVSMIVAMSENRVIGKNGKLPWHIPEDLLWFRRHTLGHPVVMGRKTYESIGRVLPERENIIISKHSNHAVPGALLLNSLEGALEYLSHGNHDEIFIIGGNQIFQKGMSLTDRIYLTLIHRNFEGDAYFPEIPDGEFVTVFKEEHNNRLPFTFYIFEKG